MAHLITIRSCKSYTYGDNLKYGTHEQIERNIARRKYPLNDVRQGYNIPFTTQLMLMEDRCKIEILPDFARDLCATNLNPYPNNMTLLKIFSSRRSLSEKYSVGFAFKLIIWLFKWINKKKTTSIILFILGLIMLQLWMWLLILIIYFNPLKPVPVNTDKTPEPFTNGNWCYNYIIGCLEDPTEKMEDKDKNQKYEQRDVT